MALIAHCSPRRRTSGGVRILESRFPPEILPATFRFGAFTMKSFRDPCRFYFFVSRSNGVIERIFLSNIGEKESSLLIKITRTLQESFRHLSPLFLATFRYFF